MIRNLKAQQCSKIRELGEALIRAGWITLDEQAKALGLPRSTTWTILKGSHKSSGLSAKIINRMLESPALPPNVRAKIIEYGLEKAKGTYGGSKTQRRRFASNLRIRDAECSEERFTTVFEAMGIGARSRSARSVEGSS